MEQGRRLENEIGAHQPLGADVVPIREAAIASGPIAGPSFPLGQAFFDLQRPLKAFFYRRTGSREATEDLLQDLWVRVHASREEAYDNPPAYLQRMAANLALDWLRRQKVRSALTDAVDTLELPEDGAIDMERVLHARRAVEYLNLLIEDLPPRRREVFLLHTGLGLKPREISRRLGLSAKTVNAHVAHAMIYIRKCMAAAELWP